MNALFNLCGCLCRSTRLMRGDYPLSLFFVLAIFSLISAPALADPPIGPKLPFNPPKLSTLRASPHKACAVWHVWRISMDNKPAANDLFTVNEMSPYGHNGKYYGAGGRMRQRPLPRPVIADPQWKIRDMETDVDRASAIGLDCFFFSLCTISPGTVCWDAFRDMLVAARNRNNGFKVMPMMDVASLMNGNKTPGQVAAAIASVANHPALMRDKYGRIYISATNGDLAPVSWWQGIKSNLANRGINVSFVLTLQAFGKHKNAYLPIASGLGTMGAGTPMNVSDVSDRVRDMHSKGKIYISGIRPQDFRPKFFWFLESSNSELFRKALTNSITSGADWIMFNSWNDREETTEFSPSTGIQWSFYDLAAYYITWFKTRKQPPIVRDVLYYFHRIMWTSTPYNHSKQTRPFHEHASEDEQPLANNIELVGFLKNPGKLQISINGKTYSKDAGKGITSFRAPLAAGRPTFRLIRNGDTKVAMQSAFRIRNSTTWQDFVYRGGSSTREAVNMVANPAVTD